MPYDPKYNDLPLTRDEVDALPGKVVLEFGANWCPVCQGFSTTVEQSLAELIEVRHIRVEDGKGKKLGRSFGVKLWPTFVFLSEGKLLGQASRPSAEFFEEAVQGLIDA